jgi:hypothetical protein
MEGTFATRDAFNETMHGVFGSTADDRVIHGGAVAPVFEPAGDGTFHAIVYMARLGTPLEEPPP